MTIKTQEGSGLSKEEVESRRSKCFGNFDNESSCTCVPLKYQCPLWRECQDERFKDLQDNDEY